MGLIYTKFRPDDHLAPAFSLFNNELDVALSERYLPTVIIAHSQILSTDLLNLSICFKER
jgi:hypothetical protein